SVERFEPNLARGSFRGWLFRIARNLTINFLETRGRQALASGESAARRTLEKYPARPLPDPDASARFDLEDRRRLFDWAIGKVRHEFTDTARWTFWMTGVDGRAGQEVASDLGTTVGTAYYHKSRIMKRLRQVIEQVDGVDGETSVEGDG
ncbi:MAG TPA: hypothetical protein VFT74_19955, partial [Isosphaeraceae bacterium]|nr:hypothetical protein [Isosphaeraceae bacterium]